MKKKYCHFCNRFIGKRRGEEGIATFIKGKVVYRCLYACKPQQNDYLSAVMGDLFDRREK